MSGKSRSSWTKLPVVSGGGTGSFLFEASSGIYTEIQCGSYAFMDADYGRILKSGRRQAGSSRLEKCAVSSHQHNEHCERWAGRL